jgi:hypothetical protein
LTQGLQESPSRAEQIADSETHHAAPPQEKQAPSRSSRSFVAAENPVLVADRLAHTEATIPLLIELAETRRHRSSIRAADEFPFVSSSQSDAARCCGDCRPTLW